MLTVNALAAADNVLIPVQAAYLPAKGLEQLLGTDHAPGVLIKIRLYHSGFGVLRHKIPLVFFEIPLHGRAESQLEPCLLYTSCESNRAKCTRVVFAISNCM